MIVKAKGLEAVKDSCYNTDGNLRLAEGIYRLCEVRGITITQALLGFFSVMDIRAAACASSLKQLAELNETLSTEFCAEEYKFL